MKLLIATTIVTALLAVSSVQAETGGEGGMRKDTASHHRLKGSSIHETAANLHKQAAKHHKLAAANYRRNKDAEATAHAKAAIIASQDAAVASEAGKELLK